jgi:hypothetical protein
MRTNTVKGLAMGNDWLRYSRSFELVDPVNSSLPMGAPDVRFEVFTAVNIQVDVFRVATPCIVLW